MKNWKDICELVGATEPIGGSWIQTFATSMGVEQTVNGSWLQALLKSNKGQVPEIINGSLLQSLAFSMGATELIGGSWLNSIFYKVQEFTAVPPKG